jgi:hypothetical protein
MLNPRDIARILQQADARSALPPPEPRRSWWWAAQFALGFLAGYVIGIQP